MSKYQALKEKVLKANKDLVKAGLVILTWGNASEIDRENGVVAIKPSGVAYDNMSADDIVITDLDGAIVEGTLNPSSDLMSHLALYKAFPEIGGVVHTHSTYATAAAQAGKNIPCYGTTHADTFYGDIPVTRALSKQEVESDYELNSGLVIVEHFNKTGIEATACPCALIRNHGPFTWGKDCFKAVENSIVLEEVAKMAALTLRFNKDAETAPQYLQDKHYYRKHGKNAYYGQKESK
ncbi:MAG: L-ribulose-5-phosphate 4-epimerase [Clostridia bacterium]|nr:L-ribulose-5-phosphate 4-epimerase [Clostridia bacterium]